MNKENIYKFLYTLSELLVVGFVISTCVDIYKHNTSGYLGSSLLYVFLLINTIEYLFQV